MKQIRDAEAGNRERESERRQRERDEANVRSLRADAENAERQAVIEVDRARIEADDLQSRAASVLSGWVRLWSEDATGIASRNTCAKRIVGAEPTTARRAARRTGHRHRADSGADSGRRACQSRRVGGGAQARYPTAGADALESERQAKALTDSMDARRRKVADAIAAADVGIDGSPSQTGG